MADFCNQCAVDLGFPEGDLKVADRKPPQSGFGYAEICEGCGSCFVDHLGNCIDIRCYKQHGVKVTAERIMKRFAEACPNLKGLGFLMCIKEIADEECGKYLKYDIQQLHDSYTVTVFLK